MVGGLSFFLSFDDDDGGAEDEAGFEDVLLDVDFVFVIVGEATTAAETPCEDN